MVVWRTSKIINRVVGEIHSINFVTKFNNFNSSLVTFRSHSHIILSLSHPSAVRFLSFLWREQFFIFTTSICIMLYKHPLPEPLNSNCRRPICNDSSLSLSQKTRNSSKSTLFVQTAVIILAINGPQRVILLLNLSAHIQRPA
jgi:hypothetical protein